MEEEGLTEGGRKGVLGQGGAGDPSALTTPFKKVPPGCQESELKTDRWIESNGGREGHKKEKEEEGNI